MAAWQFAKAIQYGAKFPLYASYPRPSGEVRAQSCHLWAHSSMPYVLRPKARHGCWPYKWALTTAPVGTLIGSELTRTTIDGLTKHTFGTDYGEIRINGAKAGTIPLAYSCTDQLNNVVNWADNVVVDDSKFVFVLTTGSDAAAGTIGAPLATISAAWVAGNAGKILVLRAGTHVLNSASGDPLTFIFGTDRPSAIIAYPGETVNLDMGTQLAADNSATGGCNDLLIRDINCINIRDTGANNWAFVFAAAQKRVVFDRVTFDNLRNGSVGDNNQGAIVFFDPESPHENITVSECVLNANCETSLLIIFNVDGIHLERYRAAGLNQPASNGAGLYNIKAISDDVCIRGGFFQGHVGSDGVGKISNQNVRGVNQEHCWYTYLCTTNDSAMYWNQQRNGPDGGPMYDYAGSIRSPDGVGVKPLHFDPSWVKIQVEGIIGYAQYGLVETGAFLEHTATAITNQAIPAAQIDATTGELIGAAVSYRLTHGAEMWSIIEDEPEPPSSAGSIIGSKITGSKITGSKITGSKI